MLCYKWATYFSIEASRPQQRRVQHVRPVGGHDDLDGAQGLEPVQLVQQLHQRALDLAVRAAALAEPTAADGVDLVHEDHARLVVLGVTEDDERRR